MIVLILSAVSVHERNVLDQDFEETNSNSKDVYWPRLIGLAHKNFCSPIDLCHLLLITNIRLVKCLSHPEVNQSEFEIVIEDEIVCFKIKMSDLTISVELCHALYNLGAE